MILCGSVAGMKKTDDFEEELENAEEEFKIEMESAAERRKKLGQIPIHISLYYT